MGTICNYLDKRFTLTHPEKWFVEWIHGGEPSSSGISVSENSALKYTPFWSSVRIISGTLSALPFKVYRRLERGKEPLPSHSAYRLMNLEPNQYMDALTFIETRQAHVLCYGNGYAEIQRNGRGEPIALWPLLPDRTKRIMKDGMPLYEILLPNNERTYLPDENVLHIKGLGFDGYTGYNVVQYHKEALGYGMAVKKFGAKFFANDASPGGVLEHPTTLSDKAFSHLKESWLGAHGGLEQAHRMQILEEGLKFNKIGVDPEQAQALEVQKWTVDDCSRIFQIPPHKLGSMEFSKYNNVEQLQIDFVCTTMLYWFKKWELECTRKLFMPTERFKLFFEFLVEGLLRGDVKSRYLAYNIGRNAGFLCADDIREKENMNPLPDGKGQIFLQPMNMIPLGESSPAPATGQSAYRAWCLNQWTRIVTKQINALAKGTNGGFYELQRDYARKLLIDPVRSMAESFKIDNGQAESILEAFLEDEIAETRHLEPRHAEILTDRLIEQIGGIYGS